MVWANLTGLPAGVLEEQRVAQPATQEQITCMNILVSCDWITKFTVKKFILSMIFFSRIIMKCQQRNLPEFSLSKTKNPANRFFGRSGPDFKNPNPDFPDWIWNFGPIRIRTQEKKSPIRIRTKRPGFETLNYKSCFWCTVPVLVVGRIWPTCTFIGIPIKVASEH